MNAEETFNEVPPTPGSKGCVHIPSMALAGNETQKTQLVSQEETQKKEELEKKTSSVSCQEVQAEEGLATPTIPSIAFGAQEWKACFGVDVGEVPPLPTNLATILDSTCPFKLSSEKSKQKVCDNHLLVLIPSTVNGEPFTLNKLGELIKPKFPNNEAGYHYYSPYTKEAVGAKTLPHAPYWLLMTCDVVSGSRGQSYRGQKKIVASYASVGYRLPYALEAATGILIHYVRSGERLFSDDPWTYTRCIDLDKDEDPFVVGGFLSSGLFVSCDFRCNCCHFGVSLCRKLL